MGGAFLVFLGVRTFLSKPPEAGGETGSSNAAGDYFSTFLLTLSNPLTIFSFAAMLGGLNTGAAADFHLGAFALIAGVFAGSALWWLTLKHRVTSCADWQHPASWYGSTASPVQPSAFLDCFMAWRGFSAILGVS